MLLVPCFTYSNDLNARIENCSNKIHYIKVTHLLFAVLCVQCSPPFADLLRAAECGCSVSNQGAAHYPSLSSVKQSNDGQSGEEGILRLYLYNLYYITLQWR